MPEWPPTSPIGQWRFDASGDNQVSGGPAAEKYGDAFFQPGGGVFGGFAYIKGDKEGIKGAIRISHHSTLHLPTAYTIEFWVRERTEAKAVRNLIYKGSGLNYNFRIFQEAGQATKAGQTAAGYTEAASGTWKEVRGPNELSYGAWHHVAFTKSASGIAYYIDGALIASDTASSDAQLTTTDIVIGESMDDTDFDNLRIYNYGLTAGQVLYNYQATSPVGQAPTVEQQLANIATALSVIAGKVAALFQ